MLLLSLAFKDLLALDVEILLILMVSSLWRTYAPWIFVLALTKSLITYHPSMLSHGAASQKQPYWQVRFSPAFPNPSPVPQDLKHGISPKLAYCWAIRKKNELVYLVSSFDPSLLVLMITSVLKTFNYLSLSLIFLSHPLPPHLFVDNFLSVIS